MDLNLQ